MKLETKREKYIGLVCYEIWMFREMYSRLSVNIDGQVNNNAFLESFAIHAYNLYMFFYPKKGSIKSTDLTIRDFCFDEGEFRKNRSFKKDLKGIKVKRDKQIAHLTKNRIYRNSRTKGWKVGKIYSDMEKTIKAFENALANEEKKLFASEYRRYSGK